MKRLSKKNYALAAIAAGYLSTAGNASAMNLSAVDEISLTLSEEQFVSYEVNKPNTTPNSTLAVNNISRTLSEESSFSSYGIASQPDARGQLGSTPQHSDSSRAALDRISEVFSEEGI